MLSYAKEYYLNNKDKMDAYAKAYSRMYRYSMSVDEYNAQYDAQGGCCLICKKNYKSLCVDHCHIQDIIRGLICRRCNVMLGMAGDSIDVLYSAIEYLLKNK